MAKKINGIKILPKYSLGSILTAILLLVCALGAAVIAVFPILSYELGGVEYSVNGLDYLNYVLCTNPFFQTDFLKSFVDTDFSIFTRWNEFTPTMVTTSWYAMKVGSFNIGSLIDLGIAGTFAISLLFSAIALLKGLFSLLFGYYSKGSKGITFFASLFAFLMCVCLFATNFVCNYILKEQVANDPALGTLKTTFQGWAYVAWAVMFASSILIGFIKKAIIKGKLYVPKGRSVGKIKGKGGDTRFVKSRNKKPTSVKKPKVSEFGDEKKSSHELDNVEDDDENAPENGDVTPDPEETISYKDLTISNPRCDDGDVAEFEDDEDDIKDEEAV